MGWSCYLTSDFQEPLLEEYSVAAHVGLLSIHSPQHRADYADPFLSTRHSSYFVVSID